MELLSRIAVRAGALGAAYAAYWLVVLFVLRDDTGDANIGVGLLAFGLLILAAGFGALRDGMRWRYADVAVVWCGTAVLVSLLAGVLTLLGEPDLSAADRVSDLVGTGVFLSLLIGLPALAAGAIGSALRPR